jgi:hypothetical protein
MHFVRADICQFILARFRISRQHLLEFERLSRDVLLTGKPRNVAVRYAKEAVPLDPSDHIPVLWRDDEVGIEPRELTHVVINLSL